MSYCMAVVHIPRHTWFMSTRSKCVRRQHQISPRHGPKPRFTAADMLYMDIQTYKHTNISSKKKRSCAHQNITTQTHQTSPEQPSEPSESGSLTLSLSLFLRCVCSRRQPPHIGDSYTVWAVWSAQWPVGGSQSHMRGRRVGVCLCSSHPLKRPFYANWKWNLIYRLVLPTNTRAFAVLSCGCTILGVRLTTKHQIATAAPCTMR